MLRSLRPVPPVIAMPSSSAVTSGPYSATISPFVDRQDPVGEREDLLELERDEENAFSSVTGSDELLMDELDRTDVEPARRLDGKEYARLPADLPG